MIRCSLISYGMRGGEPVENLPESVVRILTLGDEATFGRLVGQSESFPAVLDRVLNGVEFTPGCEFEVLNMGVPGYSVADSATLLQHRGLGFDPDVILLTYRLDDPESDELQPMKLRVNGVPIWKRFHLGRFLNQRRLSRAVAEGGGGDYYEYLHSPGGEGWGRVQQSFELIRRIARRTSGQQIPVILTLVPALRDLMIGTSIRTENCTGGCVLLRKPPGSRYWISFRSSPTATSLGRRSLGPWACSTRKRTVWSRAS